MVKKHIALAACLLGFGMSTAAVGQETVTFAAYSGIFQDTFTKAVIEPFEAANPGIKIRYFPMFNSSQLAGALYAQRNDPSVDVVILDMVFGKTATGQGLLEPLTAEQVPSIADLVPLAKIDGIAGVPVTFDTATIIYNDKAVSPVPDSWEVFTDKKYNGQTVITAPPGMLGVGLTLIYEHMAGGKDLMNDYSRGMEKVIEAAPLVKSFESRDWYPLVASGEVAVSLGWNARAQLYSDQTNGAVKAALPKEGTVVQINTINLVKGAKNRAAALKFIDYVLSEPAQTAIAKDMYYAPVNAKVKLTDEELARRSGKLEDRVVPVDWVAFSPKIQRMTEEWRRRVITR